MTVEVATTIATLDATLPAATDPKSEGDDHIRLIKSVLKSNVVSGPITTTDNTIPRFDGTTGKLLQGSGVVVDDSNNVTGVASLNSGQLAGMRNKIINGGAQVAQRGNVSITTPGAYQYGGADRFVCTLNNFTTVSGTQSRATATWAASGYAQNQLITTTGAGVVTFAQRIESIETVSLNSKTVTVSVKAYQDSGSALSVRIELYKANATDNFAGLTPVGSTYDSAAIASGSATALSTQFTLGSSDGNTGLMVFVQFRGVGAVTSKNFAISEFQLEVGSVATPFEHRPYGAELALCQRYYYRVFPGVVNRQLGNGWVTTSTQGLAETQFPMTMRIAPTTLEQSGTANQYTVAHANTGAVLSAVPSLSICTTYSAITVCTVASGLTVGQACQLRTDVTNGANAYLGWSAEL